MLLNTQTGQVESEFQYYVQPCEHPILSDFCKELTGITQVGKAILKSDFKCFDNAINGA